MPDLAVECYSGHTYAQEPRVVVWQGRRCPVARVEQRWRTPDGPAFYVRTETDELFELHYFELEDRWLVRAISDEDQPSAGARSAGRPQSRNNHNRGQGGPELT